LPPTSYQSKGVLKDNPIPIALSFSDDGTMSTELPPGAPYDAYRMQIRVQIFDDEGAYATYTMPYVLTVYPNTTRIWSMFNNLLSQNTKFNANLELYGGETKTMLNNLLLLAAGLNDMSILDKGELC
jgi:hypothetical protein